MLFAPSRGGGIGGGARLARDAKDGGTECAVYSEAPRRPCCRTQRNRCCTGIGCSFGHGSPLHCADAH
eukprot:6191014-Pleurochrysis_carterae.AAC.2